MLNYISKLSFCTVFYSYLRNNLVSKIYTSAATIIERQKLRALHAEEKKRNEEDLKSSGAKKKPDGFVTKQMLQKAVEAERDRAPLVSERDVFDYYVKITNPLAANSYGSTIDEKNALDKLNLYKFQHYLQNEVMEAFDETLSAEKINEIFAPIERYRDSGIPFTVFKSWILRAQDSAVADDLDGKSLFAYLLQVAKY